MALAPAMLNGVYGASKAYMLAFSQSLQHELAGRGVRVQAALAGLHAGEFATIPALEDGAKWDAFDAARGALHPELSRSRPASRYLAA